MTTTLPAARAQFIDAQGRPTPPFYRFLQNLKRVQDGSASDDEVAQLEQDIKTIALALGSPTGDVADIPPISSGYPTLRVNAPFRLSGLLQKGFAILSWMGTTTDVPEGERLYFTDERAQDAAVDNAITPGVTNKAPSEHAVAEALADLSPGVPYFIPDGETYKVADDIQALFLEPIELAGDSSLEIDGHLEDANVPDTFGKTYQAGTGISIANPTTATPTISSTLGSIHIDGRVATYADLPSPPPAGFTTYLVEADELVYIWDGDAFPAAGAGVRVGAFTALDPSLIKGIPTTFSSIMTMVGGTNVAIAIEPLFHAAPLELINYDFSASTLEGWTTTMYDLHLGITLPTSSGEQIGFMYGSNSSSDAYTYQDLAIPVEYVAKVDEGSLQVRGQWWACTWSGDNDSGELLLQFLDDTGSELSRVNSGLVNFPDDGMLEQQTLLAAIPANTRTIRYNQHGHKNGGTVLDYYFGGCTLDLLVP